MSDDLIKREDAIKALHHEWDECLVVDESGQYIAGICEGVINTIPAADRPQGEWIKHDDERDYCSVCKHIFKTRTLTKQDKWITYVDDLGYNYCPNCGARMKGADDE